jgi:hypothetical protein
MFVSIKSTIRVSMSSSFIRHFPVPASHSTSKSAACGVIHAYSPEAFFVGPTFLPFFNERVDQHRDIDANHKSPHGWALSFFQISVCA